MYTASAKHLCWQEDAPPPPPPRPTGPCALAHLSTMVNQAMDEILLVGR